MTTFSATERWRTAAPGVIAGMIVLRDVTNPETDSAIASEAARVEALLRERFGGLERAALRETEPIAAYARYYKRFGQQYHVAMQVESIARKGKSIPLVAALVETMFIAELESQILTAGHDLHAIAGDLVLDLADGSETFTTPRGDEATLKAGDSYVRDDEGVLSAIISGPAARARIGPDTTAAVFVVYAPAGVEVDRVTAHLEEIARLARLIAPGATVEPPVLLGA